MSENKKSFIKKILLYEITFIFFISSFFINIEKVEESKKRVDLVTKETVKIKNLKQLIFNHFEIIWSNMRILSLSEEINKFAVDKSNKAEVINLQANLKNWLLFSDFYENIKIIKKNGMEILKINYNNGFPLALLEEKLEYKGNEEYFKEGIKLKNNEIYISKMSPIFDDGVDQKTEIKIVIPLIINGKTEGVLVTTTMEKRILKSFEKQLDIKEYEKLLILNSKNEIVYKNPMLKIDSTIKNIFEKNWNEIIQNENSQLETKEGMFFLEILDINERKLIEKTGLNIRYDGNKDFYLRLLIMIEKNQLEKTDKNELFIKIYYYLLLSIGVLMIFLSSFINYKKKTAEEELNVAGEVFENAKEGILITDSNQMIVFVNTSFLRITGYSKEEVIQKKISSFKSHRHPKEFYQKMWETINKYGKWQGEIWDRRKNGEYFPNWLTISRVSKEGKGIRYIAIYDDLTLLKKNEENIRKLMDYDFLTHLPNKVLFMDRLQQLMSQSKIMKQNFTVFSLNIRNLKEINANHGMTAGDSFLKEFARIVKEKINEADTLAKVDGSNFLILFPEISTPQGALEKAEEILSITKKSLKIDSEEIITYLNIGIILYPENGVTISDLLKNLGLALNFSKEEGKNNFKFYSNNLYKLALEKTELDLSIRKALENKEFYLNYQPQVDIKTRKLIGVEALIRWKHPILGLITPVKFIPIAEENKFINTIGEWVLKEACLQNKRWIEEEHEEIVMAVNISPVQFNQEDFIEILAKVLHETKLDPKYLEVEITESMMINDIAKMIDKLTQIKQMGIKIAIDDFGTGYSSLSYIKKFPIDKIKIDRTFIKDYPENDDGRIAKTVVQLGHNLNYKVIAEGAETEEQVEYLASIDCDEIQGYYFSKPLLAEELEEKYFKSVAATQK